MSLSSHNNNTNTDAPKPYLYFAWGERVKYSESGEPILQHLELKQNPTTSDQKHHTQEQSAPTQRELDKAQQKKLALEATTPAILKKIEAALNSKTQTIPQEADTTAASEIKNTNPTLKQVMEIVKSIQGMNHYTQLTEDIAKLYLHKGLIEYFDPTVDIYVDPNWDSDLIRIEDSQKETLLKNTVIVLANAHQNMIRVESEPTSIFLSRVVKNENDFDIWFIVNTRNDTPNHNYVGDARAPRLSDNVRTRHDIKSCSITTYQIKIPKDYPYQTFFYPLSLTGLQEIPSSEKNNAAKLYHEDTSPELLDPLSNPRTPIEMAMLEMTSKIIHERIVKKAMQISYDDITEAKKAINDFKIKTLEQNEAYKKVLADAEKDDAELLPRAEKVNLDYSRLNKEIAHFRSIANENCRQADMKADALIEEFEDKILEQYQQFKNRCEDKSIYSIDLAKILNDSITEFVKKKVKGSVSDKAKAIQEINTVYKDFIQLDEKGSASQIIEQNENARNRKVLLDQMNKIMFQFSPKSSASKLWSNLFSNDLFQLLKEKIDKYIKENPQGVVQLVQSELPPILLADENKIATLIQTSAVTVIANFKKKMIELIKEIKLDNACLESQQVKIEQLKKLLQLELAGLKKIRKDREELEKYLAEVEAKNNPKMKAATCILTPYNLSENNLPLKHKFVLEGAQEAFKALQTQLEKIRELASSFTFELSLGNAVFMMERVNLIKERVDTAEKQLDAAIQKWNASFEVYIANLKKKMDITFNLVRKILLGCPYFWSKQHDSQREYVKINGEDYKVASKIKILMSALQTAQSSKLPELKLKSFSSQIKQELVANSFLPSSSASNTNELKQEQKTPHHEKSPLLSARKQSLHIRPHPIAEPTKALSLTDAFMENIVALIKGVENNVYDEQALDKLINQLNSFYDINKKLLAEKRPQSSFCSACCFPSSKDNDRGIEYDDPVSSTYEAKNTNNPENQGLLTNQTDASDSQSLESHLVSSLTSRKKIHPTISSMD